MKKITQPLLDYDGFSVTDTDMLSKALPLLFPGHSLEEMLFFDIETTGFSAQASSLYLIGVCYYSRTEKKFILTQIFADEFHEEADLIHAFYHIYTEHPFLIHYNGRTFDLPYLNKKCDEFSLPFSFDTKNSEDIYQEFHKDHVFFCKKNFPNLINKKQRSMETISGYTRKDCLDGKQLIKVYGQFQKAHIENNKQEQEFLNQLLLHNHDDLCGLLSITPLLGSLRLLKGNTDIFSLKSCHWQAPENPSISDQAVLTLTLISSVPFISNCLPELPNGTMKQKNGVWELCVTITGCYTELKYFFDDFHHYDYLPEEDMAIHKSLSVFVDKRRREKATPQTCYQKKQSWFLPLPAACCRQKTKHTYPPLFTPVFYSTYGSDTAWFEYTIDCIQKPETLIQYGILMALCHTGETQSVFKE